MRLRATMRLMASSQAVAVRCSQATSVTTVPSSPVRTSPRRVASGLGAARTTVISDTSAVRSVLACGCDMSWSSRFEVSSRYTRMPSGTRLYFCRPEAPALARAVRAFWSCAYSRRACSASRRRVS